MKKIKYWDGLRTLACLQVVLSHICMAFYPNASGIIYTIGYLCMMLLLILSGGVLSLKTYRSNEEQTRGLFGKDILFYTLKRYFRLLPVVAVSILISLLLYKTGGYYCRVLSEKYGLLKLGTYFPDGISIAEGIVDAFIGAFFFRPQLNAPFWTIHYEILGAIGVYALMKLFYKNKMRWMIYIAVGGVCFLVDIYVASMFAGMVLFDIFYNEEGVIGNKVKEWMKKYHYFCTLIVAATFLLLLFMNKGKIRFVLAMEICLCIYSYGIIQKILSWHPLVALSEYSYSIYGIHWIVICSFSAGGIYYLCDANNYLPVSIFVNVIGVGIIILAAVLIRKFVEMPLSGLFGRLLKRMGIGT